MLARLIAARDTETGGGMTAQEVRDQVVTIFMAGHETTAQALAWTWYLLSQHPAAEAKLHEELADVLGGRTPRNEDLANLPYTRMVLEEAMRLYPPAHTLGREPIAADEVLGIASRPAPRSWSCPGCSTASRRCGSSRTGSSPSGFQQSERRHVRASPTCRSAPARASASARRSPWRKAR